MKREDQNDDLIELGAVTEQTRGGPMGIEDMERTYWLHGLGLSQD